MASPTEDRLSNYQQATSILDTSRHITREEALTILIARDRVEQANHSQKIPNPAKPSWMEASQNKNLI